jgi:4-hydroxy-tetrahydrodipicolinate synthase
MMNAGNIGWHGVFSAVATPFTADGAPDVVQLKSLLDMLISEGIAGFVVAGSTGEYYSQTAQERIKLFETIKSHVGGRATLVAGTSALAQPETLELTRAAQDIGYDGCMILPPVYCLPTPSEVLAYFAQVAEVGLPIMIYNNPARVGVAISPSLAAQLAALDNVVAYKESARDLYAVAETYYATAGRLLQFAGLEPYASALLSRGAVGIVSTISNVAAPQVVAYYNAFKAGDADALSRNQKVIDQLYHLLSQSGLSNFAFVKSAMAALGRPGGACRLPHRMGDAAQIASIKMAIQRIYADAGVPLATH